MSTYIGTPEKIEEVKVTYKLKFRCAHENISVKGGEVTCSDCNSAHITQEEAASILQSYLDAQEAREIDEEMQS